MKEKKESERTAKRAAKAKQTHDTAPDSNVKGALADGGSGNKESSSNHGDAKVIEGAHRPFGVCSRLLTPMTYHE